MWQGRVVHISLTPVSAQPTHLVDEVRAVAGRGLEGDRYFKADGDPWEDPGRELTLISAEAIDALARENDVKLDYKDARRNIITRDVPLNDLVDKEFSVGDVRLRGIRLNQPCTHLAEMTDRKVLKGLVDRGGLKAQILNDGTMRVGDVIQER